MFTTADMSEIAPTRFSKGRPMYCRKCGEVFDLNKQDRCDCGSQEYDIVKKAGQLVYRVLESKDIRKTLLEG